MTASAMLVLDTPVMATTDQIAADVADEMVLLSMETGEYYGLNPVATSIWKRLQTRQTPRVIRDALLIEFEGVSEAECTAEVMRFITELLALGLVEVGD